MNFGSSRDRQSVADLEAKFVLLTSEYMTNQLTLTKRLEQSQHNRLVTEETLTNEVNAILDMIKVRSRSPGYVPCFPFRSL